MTATTAPRRHAILARLDGPLFVFAGFAAVWLAYLLLRASLEVGWQLLLVVVFWVLAAYLVLPRLHRILTRVYTPGYFIGRTRTSDGLLGDPVNLALLGHEPQVHAAMQAAGWIRADDVTLASSVRIISGTLSRTSYPEAPVSPLHLFGRQQDFAYQQEVAGSPSQRHHVRFWRCPRGWMLPGGYAVDWLAAGTYDRSVGLSLMTFQVTHRIAPDIDTERDHIVDSVTGSTPEAQVHVIRNFSTGYHSRNGGGDEIVTDGDLPVVDLRAVAAPSSVPVKTDSRDRRPAPTAFGAAVSLLRGVLVLLLALLVLAGDPAGVDRVGSQVTGATVVGLATVGLVDIALGTATYVGHNWARVLLMLDCVATISIAFVAASRSGVEPTLGSGLPVVSLGILVLLARPATAPGSMPNAGTRGRVRRRRRRCRGRRGRPDRPPRSRPPRRRPTRTRRRAPPTAARRGRRTARRAARRTPPSAPARSRRCSPATPGPRPRAAAG